MSTYNLLIFGRRRGARAGREFPERQPPSLAGGNRRISNDFHKMLAASSANSERSPFWSSTWAAMGWSRNRLTM